LPNFIPLLWEAK